MADATKPKRPLRGELFAPGSGARLVWAAALELDRPEQHALYAELGRLLATGGSAPSANRYEQRRARAIDAVREAADLLEAEGKDRKVSLEAYRRIRGAHPGLDLPADGSMRRWLGNARWNDLLRAADLEPVVDGDAFVRELGPAFTRAEVITAVKLYGEKTGDRLPTIGHYLAWVHQPAIKQLPGRRPESLTAINRLFDGWTALLVAAGFL